MTQPMRSFSITEDDKEAIRKSGKLTFPPLRGGKNRHRCRQLSELGIVTKRDLPRIRAIVFSRHRTSSAQQDNIPLRIAHIYRPFRWAATYADCPHCGVTSSPNPQPGRRACSRCKEMYQAVT